ncbi:MAG: biotin--[acetyl-CoA-carboxylase] ligase [Acidimicrobiales bacterium]
MIDDRLVGDAEGEGSTEQATRPAEVPPGWRPFVTPERVARVGSTNAELLNRAASGAPEGTVLLADQQFAGRGRLGRRWLDHPGGSVLCSVLFRPTWPIGAWYLASWAVALAAIEACSEVASVDCRCKWPNDLIAGFDHRKVGGVLAEVAPPGGVVVGIGINCNWPVEFPPSQARDASKVAARAVSLDRLAGHLVDRDAVAARMLESVARRWDALCHSPAGATALRSEYRRACATLGELVQVELPGEVFSGRGVDVDDDGRLLVDVGACVRTVDAGDVVHLRSAGPAGAD